jgi:hypothetical protein
MLLLTSGAARADAQPPQTLGEATALVTRLLQSNDVKDVAWGAFTASQYHVGFCLSNLKVWPRMFSRTSTCNPTSHRSSR